MTTTKELIELVDKTIATYAYHGTSDYMIVDDGKARQALLDHIESLSAEVERLTVERTKWMQMCIDNQDLCDKANKRCNQLRAQLEAQGEAVYVAWRAIRDARGWLNTDRIEAKTNALIALNSVRDDPGLITTHPAPAAPVVDSQWFAELLRRAMPYVKEASVRYYDGTDGHSYRQSASGLLKKMGAALHPAQPKGE